MKTKNKVGETIDEIEIYPEFGAGCAYLYLNEDNYTLIDNNGQWYTIEKFSGMIEKGDWHWMDKPPGTCIGQFRPSQDKIHLLTPAENPELNALYEFKDPK